VMNGVYQKLPNISHKKMSSMILDHHQKLHPLLKDAQSAITPKKSESNLIVNNTQDTPKEEATKKDDLPTVDKQVNNRVNIPNACITGDWIIVTDESEII